MRKTLILCLMIGATAAACGGDDAISFTDLPGDLVDARCKNAVECEQVPDLATCKAATDIDPGEIDTIQNGIDDGTIIFDGDAAAACLDEINGAGCDFDGFHTPDSPCSDLFQGTVAAGGACTVDAECAGSTSTCEPTDANCDPDTACCAGTCAAGASEVEVAIGGACGGALDGPCAINAYCKFGTAQTGTCAALITNDGGACDELDSCANPMICNFFDAAPTCETPAARGASCDVMDLLPCSDAREYCDMGTGKCTPAADVGAACPDGVDCIGFATCVNAVCLEDPGAGDSCVVDGDQSCLGALDCISGTCQFPPPSMVCN